MSRYLVIILALLGLTACSQQRPMETVEQVDIERFMGDWYVIASIPTFIEEQAFNAVESYALNDDGTIATTFTFRDGGFDGEQKMYQPTGFIRDKQSNALWGMQFIWPIKADFRIVYLDPAYATTVIARQARDYVWLMARSPDMPDSEYQEMVSYIQKLGYDVDKLRRVPHRWQNTKGIGTESAS